MALVGDGLLAVTEGIPQLDGMITRARNDLAVVGRKRDGENVVGMVNKSAGGDAGGELLETEGLIPRGKQSVRTPIDSLVTNPCRLQIV
ncbi:hypothetical protein PG988_012100 [Apiospora saccharicola]